MSSLLLLDVYALNTGLRKGQQALDFLTMALQSNCSGIFKHLKEIQCRGTAFTTLNFFHNLRIGPISQSVTYIQAGKSCQRQTLQLIGPIRKLRRKRSIMNTDPGVISTNVFSSSGAPYGRLLTLPENITIGLKGLSGTNTLA